MLVLIGRNWADAKDEKGRTARDLAEAYEHASIAKALGA